MDKVLSACLGEKTAIIGNLVLADNPDGLRLRWFRQF